MYFLCSVHSVVEKYTERKKKRTIFRLLLFLRFWWNYTKIVSYSFLSSSRMWDIKRQITSTGTRHTAIIIQKYKIWRQRLWVVKSCLLLWQNSSLGWEHSKSVFNSGEILMTETTERWKYSVNICIKKKRQNNHSINYVNKIVILGHNVA